MFLRSDSPTGLKTSEGARYLFRFPQRVPGTCYSAIFESVPSTLNTREA
jgi:hypothetical protein